MAEIQEHVADGHEQTYQPKYIVGLLTPQQIEAHWDQIGPLLDDVARTMHDHNVKTLLDALLDPNIRMFVFAIVRDRKVKALVGVELLETALQTRMLNVSFVSGQNPERWIGDAEDIILDWARSYGCTRAIGMFRKAFKKFLPDWKYTHDFLEREL